ncbi:mitochondrial ribosomal protein L17 [Dendrothele bispora CBS 962.96]|uniref:Mitochondrial ribosomal protein L17 n=1 Tax=Dendrothele bispora (strain CBS 962.96) TaxID=1314807 RepID=A0A4S8MPC9_DENBC|nr:mitochondrial ribosomal protein L17 [Dendrothele bispora CBS 962.96]
MKHGVAFRKFSRPTSHRMLMLRNLVTSLLEHEQIKTTLPKARDTARLAEKIITLGKRGDRSAQARASAFLLKPSLLPKLFGTFAERYSQRQGGYTRIHKYGNRPGDNAPAAILELVDNPRDLRFEVTSRAVGWELLKERLKNQKPAKIVKSGLQGTHEIVESERRLEFGEAGGLLRPKTRWNLQKVLRFRNPDASLRLSEKASKYADQLMATPLTSKRLFDQLEKKRAVPGDAEAPMKAGQLALGDTRNALQLSRGALGHQKPPPQLPILSSNLLLGRRSGKV